ncbi:NEAT domain-containing protein [Alkalibaculum sporogenes]|nr:NEAT domain-containing protein [Alkalibaculum sporogenes]
MSILIKRKRFFILSLLMALVLMVSIIPTVQAATTLADGTYEINVKVFKTGTTEDSLSKNSVTEKAKLIISEGNIQAQVAFKNTSLQDITVGGTLATVVSTEGEWTTYQFTISNENETVPVSVRVIAMGMVQVIDIAFQGSTANLIQEPVNETPIEEEPVNETPVEEEPVNETPVGEEPVNETPVEETTNTEGTEKVISPKTADDFNTLLPLSILISMIALYSVVKRLKIQQ